MGVGLALTAAGDLWTAAVPVSSQTGMGQVVAPFALVGIGFALSVSAMTAVLVDTVPNRLEGMASGAANMLRDFGFTLGQGRDRSGHAEHEAASNIHAKLASTPSLAHALTGFNAAAEHSPRSSRWRRGKFRAIRRERAPELAQPHKTWPSSRWGTPTGSAT